MKSLILAPAIFLYALPLFAADADDVRNAARKLAAADNYSWTIVTKGGQGDTRPIEGKTQKDGLTWTGMSGRDGIRVEAVAKGGKGVVKTEDGWQPLDDPATAGIIRKSSRYRWLLNPKLPAAQVETLLDQTTNLARSDDGFAGTWSEDKVKEWLLANISVRRGSPTPSISNAQGTVTFWLKDGMLFKYEIQASGTLTYNRNHRDVQITTTVEIKDVGATKVTVPEQAKSQTS
jgi:hypothetical protein